MVAIIVIVQIAFDLKLWSNFVISQSSTIPQGAAICAVVKDQNADIREWVDYHYRMGFDKFYIFDDGSVVPATVVLDRYITDEVVVYNLHANSAFMHPIQSRVYGHCLKRYGFRHEWMAFIDIDEFIVMTDNSTSIRHSLGRFSKFGGVGLNWVIYGSSGFKTRPEGGVSSYTKCSPPNFSENKHIKSIVQPKYTRRVPSKDPHHFLYKEGYYAVSTEGAKIDGPFCEPPAYSHMHINHYFCKSLEEYQLKIKRGAGDGRAKSMGLFDMFNDHSTETCPALKWPATRALPSESLNL